MRVAAFLLLTISMSHAQTQVLTPATSAKPVGPYSPGLSAGAYIYVSGQGALDSAGKMPEGIEAQTRLTLNNIKAILAAGGATLDHVVAVQVYVLDANNLPVVDKVYAEYFGTHRPARVTMTVARMPVNTPVEITVVAVKDLKARRAVPQGIQAGDRLYLNAVYGATFADASAKLKTALGKDWTPVYVNRYEVGSSAAAQIPVTGLTGGAKVALFAIASHAKDISRKSGCTVTGDTAFCEVVGSQGATGIEEQTAEVFGQLAGSLKSAGFSLANVVASNVYLANLDEFQRMNAKYASYFAAAPPTRTTVQPPPAGAPGPGIRLSLIAVR